MTINSLDGASVPSGSAQSFQQPPGSAIATLNSTLVSVQLPAGNLLSANNNFRIGTRDGISVIGATHIVINHVFMNSLFVSDASGTQITLMRNQLTFASLA